MSKNITLRKATPDDAALLRSWDEQQHVIQADSGSDWDWENELPREPPWREQLIAERGGTPIGFVQIIDPQAEETGYWGKDVGTGKRAIDIWIGGAGDLGKGYGTVMMTLAINRCFQQDDVTSVLVDPLPNNTGARRFYEKLGFKCLGERRLDEDDCVVYQLEREDWKRCGY